MRQRQAQTIRYDNDVTCRLRLMTVRSRTSSEVFTRTGALTPLSKEVTSQGHADMDFYIQVADNSRRRAEQAERENLAVCREVLVDHAEIDQLHAELERLQVQGAWMPDSEASGSATDLW